MLIIDFSPVVNRKNLIHLVFILYYSLSIMNYRNKIYNYGNVTLNPTKVAGALNLVLT